METPTISKKQAKKTLSGKKQKKETVKNVLAKPYLNYWPLLSPEDNSRLKETLEAHLPRIKNPKVSVPYEEIKEIPKAERKNFREKYFQQPPISTSEKDKQSLVFGVNDVTRLLENREGGCVLITSDVQPCLLVQHVIDQAVLYSVPVLIVESLRETLKDKCGIRSAVFALKKSLEPSSALGIILEAVCDISENYPVPKDHIHYDRRLNDVTTITISDVDSDTNRDSVVTLSDSDDNDKKEKNKNYHLKRKSVNQRAFVPEKSRKIDANINVIPVQSSSTAIPVVPITNGRVKKIRPYRPPVVKRLKGDKNRTKRKMENFKKKTT